MSLRIVAAWLALLTALCAAAGCSRGTRQAAAPPAHAVPGADLTRGKAVYAAQCAACHGEHGVGGPVGPSLHDESLRRPYRAVYTLVLDPAPPMPKLYPSRMSESDVRDVSAYVESL